MKKIWFFLIIFITIVMIYFGLDWYLRNIFSVLAKEECEKELSNCLDTALSSTITSDIDYEDLITVRQDSSGNITLIQSNTINMNLLAGSAVNKAEAILSQKLKSGIQIPAGYIFGGQIFGESLPDITINFRQIGNVTSSFDSTFKEAGINQTIHSVNLSLKMDALLLIPNNEMYVSTEITVPVCETIIIGNVPNEYREYLEVSPDEEDEE